MMAEVDMSARKQDPFNKAVVSTYSIAMVSSVTNIICPYNNRKKGEALLPKPIKLA